MFTACVLWLVYIPLYLSLDGVSNIIAFLSVNYINTLAILIILYAYRLHIVLFRPHMNSPEYFRKTATKSTVQNLKREIALKDGGSVTRMMSVVTFELTKSSPDTKTFVPARRYSIGVADRDSPDSFIEMKPLNHVRRRASFSSTTMLDKERIFNDMITKESLLREWPYKASKIKKSRSTPNMLDLDIEEGELKNRKKTVRKTLSPPQFDKLSRSISQFLNRVSPANSLTEVFSSRNNENENDRLLGDNIV